MEHNHELLANPDIPEELLDDHEFLRKLTRINISTLAFLPERWQLDPDFILEVIRNNPEGWRIFEIGPAEHCQNRELLLAAVKGPGQGWRALRFACQDLKKDMEFMLEVTTARGAAIEYGSTNVKGDDAVVLAAITTHAAVLEAMKSDPTEGLWLKDLVRAPSKAPVPARGSPEKCLWDKESEDGEEEWKNSRRPSKDSKRRDSVGDSEDEAPQQDVFVEASRQSKVIKNLSKGNRTSLLQQDLLEEFSNKTCSALVSAKGAVTRVVQLVVLDLKLKNGTTLVSMGRRKPNGGIVDKCMLPGHKFMEGSSPLDAVNKLLKNELRPFSAGIILKPGHKTTSKTAWSSRYKCNTQYYTALFSATMDPNFNFLEVMQPLDVAAVDIRPRQLHRPRENFCRRFCVEGAHARPDMFQLRYGDRQQYWPPVTGEWPPKQTEIFAWLPPWEIAWLSTSQQGVASLKHWVSSLNFRSRSAAELRKVVHVKT